jgi:hypothetical protein
MQHNQFSPKEEYMFRAALDRAVGLNLLSLSALLEVKQK